MKIDRYKIKNEIKKINITAFNINFNFLKTHKSFRFGSLHTFLGKSGQGKTTLMRSILFYLLADDAKVFLWLSEESLFNLQIGLFSRKVPDDYVDRLEVFSEIEAGISNPSDMYLRAMLKFNESKADIIILDNITTSMIYGDSIPQQSKFVTKLKQLAVKNNIPIIIFAHTRAGMQDNKLIEDEDIRGFKKISNMSDYFYALQMFYLGKDKIQTLRILKSRYHDNANGRFFTLNYDSKIKAYANDNEIQFADFKEIYSQRNKL